MAGCFVIRTFSSGLKSRTVNSMWHMVPASTGPSDSTTVRIAAGMPAVTSTSPVYIGAPLTFRATSWRPCFSA